MAEGLLARVYIPVDFRQASETLIKTYKLEGKPVAISYVDEPVPDGCSRKRFVCVALQQARKGMAINLSAKNISCPGGLHWLGLQDQRMILIPFLTYVEKFFKDIVVAEKWFNTVPTPPWERAKFVTLTPLDLAHGEPDLVFLVANTHEAHRIHTALTYSEGTLTLQNFFAATCQSSIGIPLVTQKPCIALPDTASRKFAKFTDADVVVSLPYQYFVKLLEDIDKSSGGTAVVEFP